MMIDDIVSKSLLLLLLILFFVETNEYCQANILNLKVTVGLSVKLSGLNCCSDFNKDSIVDILRFLWRDIGYSLM